MPIDFYPMYERQEKMLKAELDDLAKCCNEDPYVEEFVEYIVAYGNENQYSGMKSLEAQLGRDLLQFMYQIGGYDLSGMTNQYHFAFNWAKDLNSFIGNYFYDDSAFKIVPKYDGDRAGVFEFTVSSTVDAGVDWLQDPRILVEAAKANREYFNKMDEMGMMASIKAGVTVNRTKVNAILEEHLRKHAY